jgi:hypothetical protein
MYVNSSFRFPHYFPVTRNARHGVRSFGAGEQETHNFYGTAYQAYALLGGTVPDHGAASFREATVPSCVSLLRYATSKRQIMVTYYFRQNFFLTFEVEQNSGHINKRREHSA